MHLHNTTILSILNIFHWLHWLTLRILIYIHFIDFVKRITEVMSKYTFRMGCGRIEKQFIIKFARPVRDIGLSEEV